MFEVTVNTRRAVVGSKEPITTSSAGILVQFTFSEDWDGLSRFAIFRNGEDMNKIPVALPNSNLVTIPAQSCAEEYIDEPLFVGVYGSDGVGTVIIPTVWASLGVLREGAVTTEIITPAEPTPDMWAQILAIANEAVAIADECEENEELRVAAEQLRANAETARANAETLRAQAEAERSGNETQRQSAETQRQTAEDARAQAEALRVQAEELRQANEASRVSAESDRASAEQTRQSQETIRASNEAARIAAEQDRVGAETSRSQAESARASAETSRASAESSRATAEQNRASAEAARASAESARATAESMRASNEQSRVSAESARAQAETDRATEFATWESTIASKVPNTRTVNGKALSADITLDSGDIGYDATETYQSGTAGAALNDLSRQINDVESTFDDVYGGLFETNVTIGSHLYRYDVMAGKSYFLANLSSSNNMRMWTRDWDVAGNKDTVADVLHTNEIIMFTATQNADTLSVYVGGVDGVGGFAFFPVESVIGKIQNEIESQRGTIEVIQNEEMPELENDISDIATECATIVKKVNVPLSNNTPDYGTNGQLLKTRGNGETYWSNAEQPTDDQVNNAVNGWLNTHPEATTTVQNGSITNSKLFPGGNGVDLQASRSAERQTANADYAFIAGGEDNEISNIKAIGSHAEHSHAEGYKNRAFNWRSHAEGSGCIADGKISHAEGNGTICSSNDAHSEGNQTVTGRRYYPDVTVGAENAGDNLGILNYVLIPDSEGDVTSFFPNALIDNVEARYGTGAIKDSVGNIYRSDFTPAIWDGDTLVRENDLQWAMHRVCLLKGNTENDIGYVTIAKCVYTSGIGTKVYFFGENPTTGTRGIYSSYCPQLLGGGNGAHAEGNITSAYGYGAHAEGRNTRAWLSYSHAEGRDSQALALSSHAEGAQTKTTGEASHSEGYNNMSSGFSAHTEGRGNVSSGEASHSEGASNTASGAASHAEGQNNTASGTASHAEGQNNTASGTASEATGDGSVAKRKGQKAYANGHYSENGDRQKCEIITSVTKSGVGWHNVSLIESVEVGKAYSFESNVIARQIGGASGTVGDTFAYKITGCGIVGEGNSLTIIGTPTVTLVGRSAGMSGDGISTGARVSLYNGVYPQGTAIALRYDGVADTDFHFFCHTTWLEFKI